MPEQNTILMLCVKSVFVLIVELILIMYQFQTLFFFSMKSLSHSSPVYNPFLSSRCQPNVHLLYDVSCNIYIYPSSQRVVVYYMPFMLFYLIHIYQILSTISSSSSSNDGGSNASIILVKYSKHTKLTK